MKTIASSPSGESAPLAWRGGGTRPGVARHVGVLPAELDPARRSVIEAIPEAARPLDQGARVPYAIGERAGSKAGTRAGQGFGVATAVYEQGIAVANLPLPVTGIGIRRRAAGIFRSTVGVEIEFRAMPLQRAQPLVVL